MSFGNGFLLKNEKKVFEEKINFIEWVIVYILNKISIANFLILWSSKLSPDGPPLYNIPLTGLKNYSNRQDGAVEGHREWKINHLLLPPNLALRLRWLN
jgi:hypothetical protein